MSSSLPLRALHAALLLALMLALAGPLSGALAAQRVLFREPNTGKAMQRPSDLLLTADGTLEVQSIRWRRWGGAVASGRGEAFGHACNPDCASGKPFSDSVRVELTNVRQCGGRTYYTHVRLVLPSGRLLDAGFLRQSYNPCARS
jgi:hypothetical protein